jgi:hypothetical protein
MICFASSIKTGLQNPNFLMLLAICRTCRAEALVTDTRAITSKGHVGVHEHSAGWDFPAVKKSGAGPARENTALRQQLIPSHRGGCPRL